MARKQNKWRQCEQSKRDSWDFYLSLLLPIQFLYISHFCLIADVNLDYFFFFACSSAFDQNRCANVWLGGRNAMSVFRRPRPKKRQWMEIFFFFSKQNSFGKEINLNVCVCEKLCFAAEKCSRSSPSNRTHKTKVLVETKTAFQVTRSFFSISIRFTFRFNTYLF